MKIFKDHIVWWLILIILTLAISLITTNDVTPLGLIFTMLGHFAFAIIVSVFPLLFYWIIKKPLSTEEYMSTFTVAWLILLVANIAVM
jgi:Kef-type K+ transport system membrane component KefB